MMAEQAGSLIVCDTRELLKIDGMYYLPQKNDWIQKPYYCTDALDYKQAAIKMTTILDRHSGLSIEQVQIAQEQADARKAKIDKVRASHGPPKSAYRVLTEEEVKEVESYISPERDEIA
jgi:hypothetical protein